MKKLVSFILLFTVSVAYAGNNDIYITQSGTGLTMNIDQIVIPIRSVHHRPEPRLPEHL